MPKRTPSPQETKIINTHIAAILEELNAAGIYSNAVLAFVALNDWDYHLATMIGQELPGPLEEGINALMMYARDELTRQLAGEEEGAVMARAPDETITVTESMGWKQRLEQIRGIPRDGVERISISVRMLEDVIAALDHMKKLEAGIKECEGDGGCRASKFVKEEEGQRPLAN
jgi:hypothetical protein